MVSFQFNVALTGAYYTVGLFYLSEKRKPVGYCYPFRNFCENLWYSGA